MANEMNHETRPESAAEVEKNSPEDHTRGFLKRLDIQRKVLKRLIEPRPTDTDDKSEPNEINDGPTINR